MNAALQSRPYTPWQLIKLYWRSAERFSAFIFLASVLLLTIVLVGMEVVFNNWFNYFYNALQEYDKRGVIDLLIVFIFIAAVMIVLGTYRYYLQQMLGLRWRRWLTHQFVHRWLEKKSYYYLENFDDKTDNPDQRIQEDIGALVNYSLDLSIGFINAIATIFAFVYILWVLSGTIHLPLGKWGTLAIPGYLVWVAVMYALIGTYFTFKIGHPLVPLNFEQQRREANFRFAAVDLRSHAENVALYRGEEHQQHILTKLFGRVLDNWYLIILRQKLLLWFTLGYNQLSVLLPLLVALPNYFNKVFKLGGLIQTLKAFDQIQGSLSFLINSYSRIAEWQAITQRLITFLNHMHTIETDAQTKNNLTYKQTAQSSIAIKDLTVYTPEGYTLLANVNQTFLHGKNYLIKGPSGVGKSTFIRVIAGIWPYGAGEIDLPSHHSRMYIPQKIYMPLGTLQEAILFPDHLQTMDASEIPALLKECDLSHLIHQLHHTTMWSEHLSPGEQQRIAFLRILLHKPDWVFLDESTSALDLANEKHLYDLLKTQLPNCSIISIGHQSELPQFHDIEIDMGQYHLSAGTLDYEKS